MTKVLTLGGGSPGSGEIAGEDDFGFEEASIIGASVAYSVVDGAAQLFANNAANVGAGSGSFTVGDKFSSTVALSCTGVRFFWKSTGSALTVRCRLWKGTGLASVDVAVNASGVYVGTFGAPVALNAYDTYAVSVWETTGAKYPFIDASGSGPYGAVPIVGMVPSGPRTIAHSFSRFAAGNNIPSSTSGSEIYPVEPVLV